MEEQNNLNLELQEDNQQNQEEKNTPTQTTMKKPPLKIIVGAIAFSVVAIIVILILALGNNKGANLTCDECGESFSDTSKFCPNCGVAVESNGENPPTTDKYANYVQIKKGDKIENDFVLITIDDVSTTDSIQSINSSSVLNASAGEEYLYISGTIKNKSSTSYDLGSMGSYAYGNTDTMIDAELIMTNGEKEYGSLLIDNGGIYGIISDGKIASQQEVKYYIAFTVNKSDSEYYKNGEVILAFAKNFAVKPAYDHSNCEYLYRVSISGKSDDATLPPSSTDIANATNFLNEIASNTTISLGNVNLGFGDITGISNPCVEKSEYGYYIIKDIENLTIVGNGTTISSNVNIETYFVMFDNCKNISISGINFISNNYDETFYTTYLDFENCVGISIKDCKFEDFGEGLSFYKCESIIQ